MDQSDSNSRHMGEVSVSQATQRSSPLNRPFHEPRQFISPHEATMLSGQEPPQPVNEVTPIVSHSSFQQRRYNSTENVLRNESAGRKSPTGPSNASQQGPSTDSQDPHASWLSRIADRYGSLELENKGSVARDHLALERTFLAWLRTSLAFASIGIAVTQLFRLSNTTTQNANGMEITPQSMSSFPSLAEDGSDIFRITSTSERLRSLGKPLGTTFIGVAILILIIGFHRYFESQYWIIRGKFPASRGSIALTAFVAFALIVAALAVIIAISPGAIET
ncbi:hypothetical protein BJX63DRAFT_6037 [Aspergillus granulosus]|uniref:DUF202 domain-containing protein n=1 Tax=Aspergillus granulosus TaxID=176169 RepID=A0ABR4I5S8_9EURO